ncbi:selection and upkeep of intraepithelial T-cells protein 1-like [Seriola lalandi dorsalis]|uniref:selection and upkeep of intraepithelial T-cells protein 1-like n=1 Tax=Seriola lalandi dorsalis TaxID=1841481 RepID=UPI000C6F7E94|nr:selection and upkeep of intraepithelial T-cells protein 1-like [Seriola lalandi dorsalis]
MTCAVPPVWTLLFLCVQVSAATDQTKTIKAAPGQNVSLPCRAPEDTNIIVVEWSRPELEPEYVFLYRDGRCVTSYQLPSLQNRVELQDRQMKDGDVSLTLKNVTRDDTGRYECYVVQGGRSRRKRGTSEPISIINLEVHQPGITEKRRDEEGGDEEGGDKKGGDEERGDEEGNSRGRVGLGIGLSCTGEIIQPLLLETSPSE